jgi:hypothetical protein
MLGKCADVLIGAFPLVSSVLEDAWLMSLLGEKRHYLATDEGAKVPVHRLNIVYSSSILLSIDTPDPTLPSSLRN